MTPDEGCRRFGFSLRRMGSASHAAVTFTLRSMSASDRDSWDEAELQHIPPFPESRNGIAFLVSWAEVATVLLQPDPTRQ